jgi:hypothetical protein
MKENKNQRPSFARIEFRAVQALVEQRLAEGYSIKLIFEELAEAGRLTMGYTSFCDYIRGGGVRRHGPDKNAQKKPPTSNRGASSGAAPKKLVPADKSEPFKIERVPLEDLI